MTAKRLYFLMLAAAALSMVALAGCVYGASALLQNQSKRLLAARMQGAVLDEKQDQLTKAKADIEKYQPLADIAKNIVPQDKDQAQTVREIVSIAEANGISLGSITFPSSTLGGTGPAAARSQLKAVKNISGVYSLDITVQSDPAAPAPFARFLSFLDALEHNRRTALVSGVSIQPDIINPGNLTFTLNLSEYIKP